MLLNYLEQSYHLGPLNIHIYGLALAVAIMVGIFLALHSASQKNIKPDHIWELSIYCIIGAVVGARFFSVVMHLDQFMADPLYLFRIHEGGLAFYGGLIGGALAGYLYLRRKKLSFWTAGDIYAPALALGEAITRLGCDVYGIASNTAPWPRMVNGAAYHNIPLYMAVASLLLFALLWYLKDKVQQGQLFLTYLAGYFAIRTFIDFFRTEPVYSVFNQAQLAGLLLLCATLITIYFRNKSLAYSKNL